MKSSDLQKVLEQAIDVAWVRTFGVSTSVRMGAAKGDLLRSVAIALRAELKKFPCGAVGYPDGDRHVCALPVGHMDDYHAEGTVRWIGYHEPPPGFRVYQAEEWQCRYIRPLTDAEEHAACCVLPLGHEPDDHAFASAEKPAWQVQIDWFENRYGYNPDPSKTPKGEVLRRALQERQRARAEEEHGVLRCRVCNAVRDPLTGCPNGHRFAESVGMPADQAEPAAASNAVARSADSQAEPSTRVALDADEKDRYTWWTFRQRSAYDAVLHRFCYLHSLGALSQEEAAIGAALALSDQVQQLQRQSKERREQLQDLREKGSQP